MAKRLYLKLQAPTIDIKAVAMLANGLTEEFIVGFKHYDIDMLEKRIESWKDLESMDKVLQDEIVYFKNVKAQVEDDETNEITEILIEDTRKVIDKDKSEGLWETPEECFKHVLDKIFKSIAYKTAIYSAFNASITNGTSYKEDSLGN